MINVGIIGAGSWGTALSIVLSDNGHNVTVWSPIEEEILMLTIKHENVDKLPGVSIPDTVNYTSILKDAMCAKSLIVLAVPSSFIRSTAKQMAEYVSEGQVIVVVSKGIEDTTLMTLSEIVEQEIPKSRVAVLSGPSHAEEVGRRLPTTVVTASKTRETAQMVQESFMNEVFRVYTSSDVLGVEIGGALKNVIALAAGMSDGLGFGDNTKAALITRGNKEITDLALKMGASAETLRGLSGIGDLIVTCASQHSRNRKAGFLIGQGYSTEEAIHKVKMVVEGVYSAKAAEKLSKKYNVNMPIVHEVNKVLFEGQTARQGVIELMRRLRKSEFVSDTW